MSEANPREKIERTSNIVENLHNLNNVLEASPDDSIEENLLLAEIRTLIKQNKTDEIHAFFDKHEQDIKTLLLKKISDPKIPHEVVRKLLQAFTKNPIISEIYGQYGKEYKLAGNSEATTDCVQILRQSPTFRNLVDKNPTRFFSEGSDLVLDEQFGRVADVVDRKDFTRLHNYKPTKDKMYVFGLVRPPLYFNGKPNITHLQVATDLQTDPNKLAVIHASSDKRGVTIENSIDEYLKEKTFERVYVIEVDLKGPYSETRFQREPQFEAKGHDGKPYKRPSIYELPIVLDDLEVKKKNEEIEVKIDPEEKRVLELIAGNRALEYLTILTGIREGKLGKFNNTIEEMAYKTFWSPDKHSLGLHQLKSGVMKLFNDWIEKIDGKKAQTIGKEIYGLWLKSNKGKKIKWEDLTPYLTTYNITEGKYDNARVSTICSYLMLNHLYEDQLLSAYGKYNETFFSLEENPEAIIAIASSYRSSMQVYIRGSQQYRIAEIAHKLGIIDENFNFTEEAKRMPEFKDYLTNLNTAKVKKTKTGVELKDTFVADGYTGTQLSHLAYMCYKKAHPNGKMPLCKFKSQLDHPKSDLLSPSNEVAQLMKKEYEEILGKKPKLLISEDELKGKTTTGLNTQSIKFANEGLWVLYHFKKLSRENWEKINTETSPDGKRNPTVERVLESRSLSTNEISKVRPEQGKRFMSLIANLPENAWYKQYPDLLMSVCFIKGLFLEESKGKQDGQWIANTRKYLKTIFEDNLGKIEDAIISKMPNLTADLANNKTRAILAAASSVLSVDQIIKALEEGIKPYDLLKSLDSKSAIRLNTYTKSFDAQREKFAIKNPKNLERKENLTEKEKQELFVLHVFNSAKYEAEKRGFTLDFAVIATSMAALECGYGKKENEWGEPTLYAGANNIFSIKYNQKQYTENDYKNQDSNAKFYIHHTKEYFDPKNPQQPSQHYEAFRKYSGVEESIKDFFDLIEKNYAITTTLGTSLQFCEETNSDNKTKILEALYTEKYATDPEYANKALSVSKSVEHTLRSYGEII